MVLIPAKMASSFVQVGSVTASAAGASGTVVLFSPAFPAEATTANLKVIPIPTGSSSIVSATIANVSAGSFQVYSSVAGTVDWVAIFRP